MPTSRIQQAGEALERFFQENFPEVYVHRTYTPQVVLEEIDTWGTETEYDFENDSGTENSSELRGVKPFLLLTLEDVTTQVKNKDGSKWSDFITFTGILAKKIHNSNQETQEVDELFKIVEKIRDQFRYKIFGGENAKIFLSSEHSASRPVYDRQKLEEGLFTSFFLFEVKIDGAR